MPGKDLLRESLRKIYSAVGGNESATPPKNIKDTLNWWLSQIHEAITGELIQKAPPDAFDDTNWWMRKLYEGLSGEVINYPKEAKDKLEWWFQKFHEFFTGEPAVTAPKPAPNKDALAWWLETLYEDLLNSGSIPWRFQVSGGELSLTGDNLPSSFGINQAGELTVNDAQLLPKFTNWRVLNGRLYADEAA